MQDTTAQIKWDEKAREKYEKMIKTIPIFHREIAKQVVDKKAVINARQRGVTHVDDEDIVRAFLTEVPNTFYSLMIKLLDNAGFDYKKYED